TISEPKKAISSHTALTSARLRVRRSVIQLRDTSSASECGLSLRPHFRAKAIMEKFFGRALNHRTMMWKFEDGSGGSLPEELRQQMLTDMVNPVGGSIIALDRKWTFEEQNRSSQLVMGTDSGSHKAF